ncbi:MAG: hypothetical protein EA397_07675 [Deltaproteobacteria bacterium]|nr:MAG: hypothetical protein EA397_07675 [Deltaproteobacteria bacterium]
MAPGAVDKSRQPPKIERLGRYRIVRPLSKGGMALVYEARRESLAGVAPRVAVKLILPEHADSDTFRELFKNEARLGANMHHQNLVQIQDFDQVGEHFFLVMEYVEGITLRQIVSLCVRSDLEIPIGVIAEIGRQACDGLHYAHQATDERGVHLGLVHRDVKPSNLMLNPHGVVKILDFGISKGNLLAERTGAVRGTWGYMAPEQAFGREIAANADVFGLATILYEMASRQPLFRKKKPDEIKRLLDDDHAARMAATLPAAYGPLVGVLVRALQRDPAARYASAADFGRALSSLLPDPITARDEVVRFYKVIDALDQGRPVPTGATSKPGRMSLPGPGLASSPSHGSFVPSHKPKKGSDLRWLWGAAALVILMALAIGGVVIGASFWSRTMNASEVLTLDLDEIEDLEGEFIVPDPVVTERIAEAAKPEPEPPPAARPAPARPPPRTERPAPRTRVPARVAPEPVVEPEPEPEPVEAPVVVRVDRTEPPPRIVEVEEEPEPEAVPPPPPDQPVAKGVGKVTISAQPYGTEYDIFINGKLVNRPSPSSPLINYELPSGQHFVTISVAGGARKQFTVDVEPDQTVRRVWDFERNAFRR